MDQPDGNVPIVTVNGSPFGSDAGRLTLIGLSRRPVKLTGPAVGGLFAIVVLVVVGPATVVVVVPSW